ncbi:hypothetical protein H0H93_003834 [Arthromyces matolae]|nr:hypothetical protein H0H93_003834 [Arthromyces matolae]
MVSGPATPKLKPLLTVKALEARSSESPKPRPKKTTSPPRSTSSSPKSLPLKDRPAFTVSVKVPDSKVIPHHGQSVRGRKNTSPAKAPPAKPSTCKVSIPAAEFVCREAGAYPVITKKDPTIRQLTRAVTAKVSTEPQVTTLRPTRPSKKLAVNTRSKPVSAGPSLPSSRGSKVDKSDLKFTSTPLACGELTLSSHAISKESIAGFYGVNTPRINIDPVDLKEGASFREELAKATFYASSESRLLSSRPPCPPIKAGPHYAGLGRMQATATTALPSPHPIYYPSYHPIPLPGPQDHDLKKKYLALLPPQQIIDICLNFDLHVPPYVKNTVWPPDINAAIAAIKNASASSTTTTTSTSTSTTNSTTKEQAQQPSENSIEKPADSQPPDKPPSPPPDTATVTTAPTPAQQQQQPPYPHQPYGYPHAQPAYPHTPYYQHPPGYPPYPAPYSYPHHIPGAYPQPSMYPQTTVPYGVATPATTASLPQASSQQQDAFPLNSISADDLPSYEEMIVEALADSTESDGCAPKDLFTWMAARYPVQQNFRPSASQALQKAFKRGRFLKSSNGKYKLNAEWEGGNTSRRTTRRPQTINSTASPAPASPFTNAPLVHHNQQSQSFGFPFQQPQPATGFGQTAQAAAATAPTTTDASQGANSAQDAWEAAQNILKAINFDTLLSMPKEEDLSEISQSEAGPSTSISAATTQVPAPEASSTAGAVPPASNIEDYSTSRAELQAHLALLAAQLAELSQEDEEHPVVHYPVVTSTSPVIQRAFVAPEPPVTVVSEPAWNVAPMTALPPPPPPEPWAAPASEQTWNAAAAPIPSSQPTYQNEMPISALLPPSDASVPSMPPAAIAEEEEDSEDDDDMEEVI